MKKKSYIVAIYKMCLCPDYRNTLILWVTHLYFTANFRSLHERAFLGKCGRKSLCAHAAEMKLLAWWVCRSSHNAEETRLDIYTGLFAVAISLYHCVCSWSYQYGLLLCSIQRPNELSGRSFSLGLQTSNELAHSRCFMESKLLRIERDFTGVTLLWISLVFTSPFCSKATHKRSL